MERMTLVYAENRRLPPPEVAYRYAIDNRVISIEYEAKGSPIFGEPWRPRTKPAYALWMMDVAEFFGRRVGNRSYFEFQVSPYNQYFEQEVIRFGREIDLDYRSGFRHRASIASRRTGCWRASMRIPLNALSSRGGDAEEIEGNFFAILGRPLNRFYFSAFLKPWKKMSTFHQADRFRVL